MELANPARKVYNLGALRVGETASKRVKLVNRSALPVTFTVSIVPSAPVPALQQHGVLSVKADKDEIILMPNKETTVEVAFSPKARIPQFIEEVMWV